MPLPAFRLVAPNGLNTADLGRFPSDPVYRERQTPVFGTVTRFSEIKAPLNTIKAFARVRAKKPCRLMMVGDGRLWTITNNRAGA